MVHGFEGRLWVPTAVSPAPGDALGRRQHQERAVGQAAHPIERMTMPLPNVRLALTAGKLRPPAEPGLPPPLPPDETALSVDGRLLVLSGCGTQCRREHRGQAG